MVDVDANDPALEAGLDNSDIILRIGDTKIVNPRCAANAIEALPVIGLAELRIG